MKYELENRSKASMISHVMGIFRKSPDVRRGRQIGQPAMTGLRPSIPASVPPPAGGTGTGISADVTGLHANGHYGPRHPARCAPQPAQAGGRQGRGPAGAVAEQSPVDTQQQQQLERQSKKNSKK